jgi:hypothetical protein
LKTNLQRDLFLFLALLSSFHYRHWTISTCELAQIPPEIWMTLPLEANKWLLNERKRQQQEDDKM